MQKSILFQYTPKSIAVLAVLFQMISLQKHQSTPFPR